MLRLIHHPEFDGLSFQEERALPWIFASGGLSSNVNAAIAFEEALDAGLLMQCLAALAHRHEAIRTRFVADAGGTIRRCVLPPEEAVVSLTEETLGSHPDDPAVQSAAAGFCNRPFTPADPHWLRALHVRTGTGASVLALSMPHIVSDAVSMRLLIAELWRRYADLARGRSHAGRAQRFQLRDFAGSQRAWAATPDYSSRFDWLVEHMAAGIAAIRAAESPHRADAPLPARHSVAVRERLAPALCDALARLARDTQAGLLNTLLAGAMIAIARIFGRHFCFRMPFANRMLTGSEDIIGFLANDLPFFVSIDSSHEVGAFVRHVHKTGFSLMRFGAVPWSELAARMQTHAIMAAGRNPFDDYVINIFPPADDLVADEDPHGRWRARNYPMSLAGFTTNVLKVWMHTVNGQTGLILRVGEEQQELAARTYMPAFLHVFETMARDPRTPLRALLD